jgi:hypothetical protein
MWPFDHVFMTYTWPGPFGWLARNCPGNIVADVLFGTFGYLLALRKQFRRIHDTLHEHHSQQMAAHETTRADLHRPGIVIHHPQTPKENIEHP